MLLVMLGFSVIGFVYGLLGYIFWIGLIAIGGYAGYKIFLEKDEPNLIEGKNYVSDVELDKAKKVLEKYRQNVETK